MKKDALRIFKFDSAAILNFPFSDSPQSGFSRGIEFYKLDTQMFTESSNPAWGVLFPGINGLFFITPQL